MNQFEEPTKPPNYASVTKCSACLLYLGTVSLLIGIIMTATNPPSSTGNSAVNISGPILLGFALFNAIISATLACRTNKKVKEYNMKYFQQAFPSAPPQPFNQSSTFQPQISASELNQHKSFKTEPHIDDDSSNSQKRDPPPMYH